MKRIIMGIVGVLWTGFANAGLFGLGGDSWKEEVLLHDGRTIMVERSQSYGGRREPGQSAPIKEQTIKFKMPNSGEKITWVSEYSKEIGRTNFTLLAIHVLDGVPYVIASPNLCLSYNKWGRPNPPYVLFKYSDGTWSRISIDDLPREFKTINVVVATRSGEALKLIDKGSLTSKQVRDLNASLERVEYRGMVRGKITSGTYDSIGSNVNCEELVYRHGAWMSPGDSIGDRMMEGLK